MFCAFSIKTIDFLRILLYFCVKRIIQNIRKRKHIFRYPEIGKNIGKEESAFI